MQRPRGELVPIGDALSSMGGPVKAIREATPQAQRHFTRFDQVDQLVGASEADPDLGFMARMMALCSLPRTNPGTTLQYKRVNGPYKLVMIAGADCKLPFGNLPRLLLAWVSTEAVRTQRRELVLGKSLSEFMRTLGVYSSGGRVQIRLRNQMRRLFSATVQLVYEDEHGEARVSSSVADRTELWWNERKPDKPVLWDSKIRLGEDFFNEIIQHPVPIDMNTLTALKRCSLGLDLYLWLVYRTFPAPGPATAHLAAGVPSVRLAPGQGQRQTHRSKLPQSSSARAKEDQAGLAGSELHNRSGPPDPASLGSRRSSGFGTSRISQLRPFPGLSAARQGPLGAGWTSRYPPLH